VQAGGVGAMRGGRVREAGLLLDEQVAFALENGARLLPATSGGGQLLTQGDPAGDEAFEPLRIRLRGGRETGKAGGHRRGDNNPAEPAGTADRP